MFPGRDGEQPLSNMALLMAVRRLGVDTTVHGFRSSFRDWTAEQTSFPREVCEMGSPTVLEMPLRPRIDGVIFSRSVVSS